MAVYTITGSKFEIGAVLALKSADFVAGDFTTALAAAVECKEPKTFGGISDEWTTGEFGNVTDGRVRTLKYMRKGKAFDIVFGLDPNDAGQLALRAAAVAPDANYAFRFTFSDKPVAGAAPKNSTRLFMGVVLSVEDDASGEVGLLKVSFQSNSNIVATHASAT